MYVWVCQHTHDVVDFLLFDDCIFLQYFDGVRLLCALVLGQKHLHPPMSKRLRLIGPIETGRIVIGQNVIGRVVICDEIQ